MKGFKNPYEMRRDTLVTLTWCLKHKGVSKDMIKYIAQFIQVDFSIFNNIDGKMPRVLNHVHFVHSYKVAFAYSVFDWRIPCQEFGGINHRRLDACKYCLGPIITGAVCMWCTTYPFATTDLTEKEFKKRNILYSL